MPEKSLLFCSNCKQLGRLKYMGQYLCISCFNDYSEMKEKMEKSLKPTKESWAWISTCEG